MEHSDKFLQIKQELQNSFKLKKWLTLSETEIDTLIVVCELNGDPHSVYSSLLGIGGNHSTPQGKQMWRTLDSLSQQWFIWVEREGKKVIKFHFLDELKDELKQNLPHLYLSLSRPQPLDHFKFTIRRNTETIRILTTQAPYSGVFIPQKDMVLSAGKEYKYSGWINDDHSITLRILPSQDLWGALEDNS